MPQSDPRKPDAGLCGESQARNRYTIAAGIAHKSGLEVIQGLFLFTADQEKAHARQFYRQLHDLGGQTIRVDGTYPVTCTPTCWTICGRPSTTSTGSGSTTTPALPAPPWRRAFPLVGKLFENIANVEKIHGDRFGRYADMLEQGRLFASDTRWSGCA